MARLLSNENILNLGASEKCMKWSWFLGGVNSDVLHCIYQPQPISAMHFFAVPTADISEDCSPVLKYLTQTTMKFVTPVVCWNM